MGRVAMIHVALQGEKQMSVKFVVGFDGSAASQNALDFAIARAKAQGGRVVVAHVLEWSPYSFLTPQEIEERHGRRSQELARAEEMILLPAVQKATDAGVETAGVVRYGHIAQTLCKICKEEGAHQIVVGRHGHSEMASRVFGSVAGSLVQVAPVPCTVVP